MTTGKDVAKYAKSFLGKGSYYSLGGTSLTGPCDCSGYYWRIMKHFFPEQFKYRDCAKNYDTNAYGKKVKKTELKPGDGVMMHTGWRGWESATTCDHVGIYLGDGKIIQCGHNSKKSGIYVIEYKNCSGIILHGRRIINEKKEAKKTTTKYERYRANVDLNYRTSAKNSGNKNYKGTIPAGTYVRIYKKKNGWGYSKALKGWLWLGYMKKVK